MILSVPLLLNDSSESSSNNSSNNLIYPSFVRVIILFVLLQKPKGLSLTLSNNSHIIDCFERLIRNDEILHL